MKKIFSILLQLLKYIVDIHIFWGILNETKFANADEIHLIPNKLLTFFPPFHDEVCPIANICNFFTSLDITNSSDQEIFTFGENSRVRIAWMVKFRWMNFDIAHRRPNSSLSTPGVATKDFHNWKNLGLIIFSTLKLEKTGQMWQTCSKLKSQISKTLPEMFAQWLSGVSREFFHNLCLYSNHAFESCCSVSRILPDQSFSSDYKMLRHFWSSLGI